METLVKDLRHGYKTLIANPGFTIVAVLSLALGIGANTAIFSFIDMVLLKNLPVRDPASLVLFGPGTARGNSNEIAQGEARLFSWREFQDLRANQTVFDGILAVDSQNYRIYATFDEGREAVRSVFVSSDYFPMLGLVPQRGRFFDASVDSGPSPRAVISDDFFTRRFHRDPSVVGSSFRAANREYTVVGVAPRGFFGTRVGESPDMWIPVTMQPDFPTSDLIRLSDAKCHFLNIIARLKPGLSAAQAETGINLLYQRILPQYKGNPPDPREDELIRTAKIRLTPADKGIDSFRRKYEAPLVILMAVVALVLLIACANVANLLVALGAKRQREMAVRIAIGAGRARLIRQVLTEGIMLSAAGGILGLLVAMGAGMMLVHLISTGPVTLPISFELNGAVLLFTSALSLFTGIAFSLLPAIRASRININASLREGKASMASPRKVTFGRLMVVSQVALSLALLVTAGMLVRSLQNLGQIDTGFRSDHVLVFKVDSESSGYKQDERLSALYERITRNLERLPGVVSASASLYTFSEGGWGESFRVPGVELPPAKRNVSINFVTPDFFTTFRIPLLAGRTLSWDDNAAAPLAVVISQTMVQNSFGSRNPIGQTVIMSPVTAKDAIYTVVGVVPDVKSRGVREEHRNSAWLALAQGPVFAGNITVRTAGDPRLSATRIRAALHDLEPGLPIRLVTTLSDEVGDSLVSERALAQLSGIFAALALLLSAIGLYGTVSFSVARRTSEIGIRMALGAERTGVLGMVLKDALTLILTGIAIGLPVAFLVGRALQAVVYNLGSFDVLSIAAGTVGITLTALVACYLPARRAARVDPLIALHYE